MFETDTDNVVPLTLLEYTIHQLVVFGTIIVLYPLGQAVTVAVFVLFAPLLIEPKIEAHILYLDKVRYTGEKRTKNDR